MQHYDPNIDKFLRVSKVKDEVKYKKDIITFKTNPSLYQKATSDTMLKKHQR